MTQSIREKAIEAMAHAIAQGLGDTFEHAFMSKSEWTAARGERGGRYRDINEPMQSDYMDAAAEAFDTCISVLMEPDSAMREAAMAELSGPTDFDPKAAAWDSMRVYRVMLKAASQ